MWWVLISSYVPLVSSQCYWNNKTPYLYFGSKTPYDTVRGDLRDIPKIEGCKPISIWFMARHGIRRPNEDDARIMRESSNLKIDILNSYASGNGTMCAQDIADLRNWNWNPKLDDEISYLTSKGYQELLQLGQRFAQKFKEFLIELHKNTIRPTSAIRTQKSAKAFVDGLEEVYKAFVIEDPIHDDPVARPYRYCDKRGVEIINGTRASNEIQRFQKTREFKQVQRNVQKRTGLAVELTPDMIMSMYDLCRFYRSYALLKRNPWCSLFTDDDLEVLEYVEDISHYFENGYGDQMNALTGASGLKDLYEKFERAHSTGRKSLTAYFTHETMLEMLYTAIGLYRDYPEISGYERNIERKWRTSLLTPFAANFVAVLHRCSAMETGFPSYNIQFFINEKELRMCGTRLCTWNEFWNMFQKFSNASLEFCNDSTYEYSV